MLLHYYMNITHCYNYTPSPVIIFYKTQKWEEFLDTCYASDSLGLKKSQMCSIMIMKQ